MKRSALQRGTFFCGLVTGLFAAASLLMTPSAEAKGKQPKVEICHIPPGNPDNAHTIRVSGNAIKAHLKHGDYLGPCGPSCQDLCEDNNACTQDDCVAGECVHTPVNCDDGNECTADSCDPASGCTTTPIPGASCTGQASDCTLSTGTCDADGTCALTIILDCCVSDDQCDDGDLCTGDSCDGNECEFVPVECVPPNGCYDSGCDPGTGECVDLPVVCAAAGPCETLSYDCTVGPGEDPCVYAPIPGCCEFDSQCDDEDSCTEDSCLAFECVHEICHDPISVCDEFVPPPAPRCDEFCNPNTQPVDCEDGDLCTDNTCDEAAGGCVTTATDCSDGNECTQDQCDPATGCDNSTPVTCDDGSACTTDACDPATGCGNDPISCDDFDECTAESCDPLTGCGYDPVVCDDGNACTANACDPASGCVFTPIPDCCVADTECPDLDGNLCTRPRCDQNTNMCFEAAPLPCPPGFECNPDTGSCEEAPAACPCFTPELMEYNSSTWAGSGGSCYRGGTVAPGGVALFGATGWQTQARVHLRTHGTVTDDIHCYRQMRGADVVPPYDGFVTLSGYGTPPLPAGAILITPDEWNACNDLVEAEIALVGLTCQ